MKKIFILFAAATSILIFTPHVKAELIDRGEGLIYDTSQDITWLQNANYSGHTMTWLEADQWTEDLVFQGYEDWRLPDSLPCTGYNCTESEMGHLYYLDGITADAEGPFIDVRSYMYWSGSENNEDTAKAWRFHFNTGYQGSSSKTQNRYAWAVRDGDITPPVAPEPVSSLLFVTGSILLSARQYRKKKQNS